MNKLEAFLKSIELSDVPFSDSIYKGANYLLSYDYTPQTLIYPNSNTVKNFPRGKKWEVILFTVTKEGESGGVYLVKVVDTNTYCDRRADGTVKYESTKALKLFLRQMLSDIKSQEKNQEGLKHYRCLKYTDLPVFDGLAQYAVYILDYYDCPSLDDWIKKNVTEIKIETILKITYTLLCAVREYFFDKKCVHRDLRTPNILIHYENPLIFHLIIIDMELPYFLDDEDEYNQVSFKHEGVLQKFNIDIPCRPARYGDIIGVLGIMVELLMQHPSYLHKTSSQSFWKDLVTFSFEKFSRNGRTIKRTQILNTLEEVFNVWDNVPLKKKIIEIIQKHYLFDKSNNIDDKEVNINVPELEEDLKRLFPQDIPNKSEEKISISLKKLSHKMQVFILRLKVLRFLISPIIIVCSLVVAFLTFENWVYSIIAAGMVGCLLWWSNTAAHSSTLE